MQTRQRASAVKQGVIIHENFKNLPSSDDKKDQKSKDNKGPVPKSI